MRVGLLGADFEADQGRWRIRRIFTAESWNPSLEAPLDRPGLNIEEGHYLVGVDGRELTDSDDPYRLLDGTADRQTVLHLNESPTMEGAWTETVVPIQSENGLRQRAWVEDNRRYVDERSGGDFFPWVFRQQQAGPLIGMRTWGGLVKSSVHYALVDGGALTAPDNAVFDPINNQWIAENEGIAPDIEVRLSARALAEGRDPQLDRAIEEALRLLEAEPPPAVVPPPFSAPARGN